MFIKEETIEAHFYKLGGVPGWVAISTKPRAKEYPMLVLARRVGEEIVIGGDIRVTVLEVRGSQVRLGIVAPQDVRVLRQEIEHRSSQSVDAPLARVLSEAKQLSRSDSRIMAGLVHIAR